MKWDTFWMGTLFSTNKWQQSALFYDWRPPQIFINNYNNVFIIINNNKDNVDKDTAVALLFSRMLPDYAKKIRIFKMPTDQANPVDVSINILLLLLLLSPVLRWPATTTPARSRHF